MYNIFLGFVAGGVAAFMGSPFWWAVGTGVVVFVLWTLFDLVFIGPR